MATVTDRPKTLTLSATPRDPHVAERDARKVNAPALAAELHRAVRGEVRFDSTSRAAYCRDGSNYRQVPIGVVVPRDIDDVIHAVAVCRKYGAPVLGRGGGTSLAGQCCNVAVVFDFSKYMHHVLELNPQERYARVQPGAILDDLREQAEQHNLTFGPDPSTHRHCTLGGMIGNNSCGVHSVMAGRTADNLEELTILTYDGEVMTVGPTSEDELERLITAGGRRGEIYGRLKAIRDRYGDEIRRRFPHIPRRVSGFNLDNLFAEQGCNVARALAGSEGTCALILEAKVKLIHSPPCRTVVVLGFQDVFQAGDAAHEVRSRFLPCGLEGMDDELVQFMKEKHMHPKDVGLLPKGAGWLLVEFGGETEEEADRKAYSLCDACDSLPGQPTAKVYCDEAEEKRLWEVRESGLGATAYVPGQTDTHPGWEDSAVPPEQVGPYLRDLRKLYDKYGYSAALYGHFGDGCIHCRVNFDLVTPLGIETYKTFLDEASDLILSYGGSLSGEHGDGQARGPLLYKMFGPDLINAFREFKETWDPGWKMNPGKVIDSYAVDENLVLGTNYKPYPVKTVFAYIEDKGNFAHAANRCVGVGKCRNTQPEETVMCPSYMATREEIHSTRGRSRVLHEMMVGEEVRAPWDSPAVHEALDLCLACKGCKSDCPVNVDMATYKSEFYYHYYKHHLPPRPAFAMGLIYWWSRLASYVPNLANVFSQTPGLAAASKWAGGLTQHRPIPPFAPQTFKAWFRQRETQGGAKNVGGPPVLLFPDTFTNHLHPRVAMAAVEVLEHFGFHVMLPQESLCCGRPLYDYGFLDAAKTLWLEMLEALRPQIRAGVPLVGLEPSCLAAFRDELPGLFPHDEDAKRLTSQAFTLSEFIIGRCDHEKIPRLDRKALVHVHCHQHAVMKFGSEEELYKKMGLDAEKTDAGCCGLAGSFGFESEHYDISMTVGEHRFFPKVRAADPETLLIADGFSCETQMKNGTDREALHTAQVLQMAMRNGPAGTPGPRPERHYPKVDATPRLTRTETGLAVAAGVALGGLLVAGVLRGTRRDR